MSAQKEIGRIASAMLDGSIHYLSGARQLAALRHDIGAYENDPDFMPFVAILSEIESLPFDTDQEDWLAIGLKNFQAEIKESTQWAKTFSLNQCQALADRFQIN